MGLILAIIIFALLGTTVASATQAAQAPTKAPEPKKTLFNDEELKALVDSSAEKFGANANQLLKTVQCEAKKRKIDGVVYYDATAQSDHYSNGVRENSWGLAQWHLDSGNDGFTGQDITLEQATDPEYSVDLMASYFSDGRQSLWSCYRKYYR